MTAVTTTPAATQQPHLHIFANRKKFDDGITPTMTVDAIARLVGLTAETATVRREHDGKAGDPLQGTVEIHQADHFVVTRNQVQGGFDSVEGRIAAELQKLRESGQRVDYVAEQRAVVYRDLPVASPRAPVHATDVLVPVGSYPGMLDLAFLPVGSPLIGRVKGAAQGVITVDGQQWQQISYHPHNGGGGPAWNPNLHGFHTYIDELLAWLGSIQ
jgi:hypothetical protein